MCNLDALKNAPVTFCYNNKKHLAWIRKEV